MNIWSWDIFFISRNPMYSVLSIFGVFRFHRFFRPKKNSDRKKNLTFSKKRYPPELNYMEKISTSNFSKNLNFFRKRSKLRKVFPAKLYWFKYELPTPTESKVTANRTCHINLVQGVELAPGYACKEFCHLRNAFHYQ